MPPRLATTAPHSGPAVPSPCSLTEPAPTAAIAELRRAGPAIRVQVWTAMLGSLAVLTLLMHRAQLAIDPWQAGNRPFYAAGLLALIARFVLPRTRWRHALPLAHFSEYAAIFTMISLMGATASYPVAALTSGYADARLQAIDVAMGFDWVSLYRLVAAHPVLQAVGTVVYRSIYVTPAVLLWCAARSGRHDEAYRFIAGFWLATVLTLLLFSLMPAIGPFSYLWHSAIPYMPESEQWQEGLIPALRAYQVHIVDLGHLRGIVSAPSFHTAAAVLYIAAGWRIPALRWWIVALNAGMLLSTPVEGTHYLVDMVFGAGVAGIALSLTACYRRLTA